MKIMCIVRFVDGISATLLFRFAGSDRYQDGVNFEGGGTNYLNPGFQAPQFFNNNNNKQQEPDSGKLLNHLDVSD